ncbi:hypothetical protein [Sphingobium indicum]|nr:hypothetical protein [Sphingobium indicum]
MAELDKENGSWLEFAWREYEICRTGIQSYDSFLFHIRSWSISLNAILLAGYFGFNSGNKILPGTAVMILTLSASMFWLLDGLNKSLQMVHIYNSRDIEEAIRYRDNTIKIPTISLRYKNKNGRHVRPTLKNISDESVWPFYVLPIILSSTMIVIHSYVSCEECELSNDWWVGLSSLSLVLILIIASLSLKEHSRSNFKNKKSRKNFDLSDRLFWRKKVSRKSNDLMTQFHEDCLNRYIYINQNKRIGPYVADLSWESIDSDHTIKYALFIDGPVRLHDESYIECRRKFISSLGYTIISHPY